MTATNKITTEKIKATSGISVTKTASSTTEEPTKRTNIYTDLDIQNNFRQIPQNLQLQLKPLVLLRKLLNL